MPRYDASDADVFIYAKRNSEALLSSMGHDLKIRVGSATIDVAFEDGEVEAHFDADSLEPVDAIKWESREETEELSEGDRHEISQRMSQEVLEVEEFPEIAFRSTSVEPTDEGWHVEGELELHGETRTIDFDAVEREDDVYVETSFDHTDFDIEPYSAMLGSLEVEPEVVVTVSVPKPEEG